MPHLMPHPLSILQRYVFGRIVGTFLLAVTGTLLFVWVVQALQRVNLITDGGSAVTSFLWIAFLILPRILTIVLPFALVIAVVNALNGLNDSSETVVVSAAGGGRRVFVVPVLVLAALVTLAQLLTAHWLEPVSRQAFRGAVAEARAEILSSVLRPGQFRALGSDVTVHVDARDGPGELSGFLMSDRREADETRTYYARQANVVMQGDTEYLLMRDGEVHVREVADGSIQVVEYQSYALDLTSLTAGDGNDPVLRAKDRNTAELLSPDPEDAEYQRKPGDFRAELHKRLSGWLYVWAFCAVALHAAARPRSTRETSASTMGFVLLTCLVVRGLGFALEDLAASQPLAVPLLYLVPGGTALLFATAMAFDRRFVLPPGLRRVRNRVWDGVQAPIARLRARMGAAPVAGEP